MDAGGVPSVTPGKFTAGTEAYVNRAFDPELGHINGNLASEPATYDELPAIKRDTSSVDFSLPTSRRASRKSQSGSASRQERSRSGSDGGPYRGMGKEELLRFSNRPFWRNLRYMCMSVVLTGWLALLITVVAIVLTYPQCREAQPKDWWQKAVIYRVYVPSFLDTGCDGIGDLKGVLQKLDYLKDLGVNTIALSPIYKLGSSGSGSNNFYLADTEIVNHTDIDPIYGTMGDFKTLVNKTHEKGMHITLDFIPNHTSDEHPWFTKSKTGGKNPRSNEFRSYYVWADGTKANQLQPPNNWKSTDGCSAWMADSENNNVFYLHQFKKSQPDLNLRSQKVRDELEAILKFWLDLGVDGFYVRDSNFLFEDYDLRDEKLVTDNLTAVNCDNVDTEPYEAYDHQRTQGLTEVFDMLARWRAFLDDYGRDNNQYKILLADVDGSYQNVMDYYGLFNRDGVDFPLNKFSLGLNETAGGHEVAKMVGDWMKNMPSNRWANWMGGDDRSTRLADRLGDDLAKPYLMLIMLLPGTPYFYYGDEIGLRATTDDDKTAAVGTGDNDRKKPMRGPMQWSKINGAGFSNRACPPWMPYNDAYNTTMNVEAQKNDPESLWNLFRNLTQLREGKPSFEYGDYIPLVQDDQVFSFVREFDGERGYLVALNFASEPATKQLSGLHETVPDGAKVEVVCGNDALHKRGGSAGLDFLKLMPYEGIVVSWAYRAKEL